jgi:hypothetical protein
MGNRPLMAVRPNRVVALVVLVALAVAAVVAVLSTQRVDASGVQAPSAACSTRLIHDWSDGAIDRTYPIRCYRSALASLPADLRIYSSAPEDIAHALSSRLARG